MSTCRWPRPRPRSTAIAWAPAFLAAAFLAGSGASAQDQATAGAKPAAEKPTRETSKLSLVEPTAHRVYQRDRSNRADIPIVLSNEATIVGATLANASPEIRAGFGGGGAEAVALREGKVPRVPVGGPYTLSVTVQAKDPAASGTVGVQETFRVGPIYVGDLWVLAGQSNMEGVGLLEDVTPPSGRVGLLGMDGDWRRAEEPLHWLVDSPDPVHSGDPATRAERSSAVHKGRVKGAGLGLPFGVALSDATGVSIGLIATAHGGTSMQQWDPSRKDDGGRSLYGSMLGQFRRAGGRVRGVLWYQGEAETKSDASAKEYPRTFASFIRSVREDLGDPELPFYLVQLGRVIRAGDPGPWNAVQDAQRRIPDRIANTAVVAAVDLELDDGIHIATPGLKRLGARLARVAERELYGLPGATTPTFERVYRRGPRMLVVKFKEVNRISQKAPAPAPALAPAGIVPPSDAAKPATAMAGLRPSRHVSGFSIRKDDGTDLPLIYDAAVGPSHDTVILKLDKDLPAGANLWYGRGLDPFCNLTDALDMAVPVFGPVPLDEVE